MSTRVASKTQADTHHEAALNVLDALAHGAAAIAGMQPTMLDRRSLRHTLKRRMAATHHGSYDTYLAFYTADAEERSAFLEGVLIGETSFFRDAVVFAEMCRWCVGWFARHKRPMRILSAPCSTGEEPYSIAATLAQAGVPLDRFTIEALDISPVAIEHAQAAVYKGFSLRNLPNPEQSPFLEQAVGGWRVTLPFRDVVRFRQANLMDADALGRHHYDLVCSRNLLLYQAPAARSGIAETLAHALAPGGRLIIGAADWGRDLDKLFLLEEPVHSFALRLRTVEATEPEVKIPKAFISLQKPTQRASSPTRLREVAISHSQQLADVTDIYRKALQAYLRGEEREAERLCRQSLYLETDHMPSLEILTKIHRPHASGRMQFALRARLKRHRDAVAEGEAR